MNNVRNSDSLISDIKDKAAKISDFTSKDSNYPLIFKNLDEKILKINKKILEALKEMCEVQALDSDFSKNFDLPLKQDYFLIISKKTGALFSASCFLGGLIIDLENKLKDLAKEYTEFAINEIKEINGGEDAKKYFIEFFYYEWC
jgi:geranylgeranyl pyrophosphate synthase